MRSRLTAVSLQEVVDFHDGDRSSNYPKRSEFVSSGVPFLNAESISTGKLNASGLNFITREKYNSIKKGRISPNDTVLTMRGNGVGAAAIIPLEYSEGLINAQMLILRSKDPQRVDPIFLFYYLASPIGKESLVSRVSGSAQPQLTIRDLRTLTMQLPSINEQRRIAEVLRHLDDKIEINRRTNETLEQVAHAVFKSWFIAFDPVHSKAVRKKPFGIDADIAALFPDSFEPSELGEIPRGWKAKPLTEVVSLIGGGTPKTSIESYWDGDIPWFSVVDSPSPSDVWVLDTQKHITKAGLENSSARILRPGTTIISARGTVGNLALVGSNMAMNQSCYGIVGQSGYPDFFVYFVIKNLVNDLKQRAHGSVFDTITRETFASSRLVTPPDGNAILSGFEKIASPLLHLIKANAEEVTTLVKTRDILLPRLLSGEITIKEVS